MTGHILPSQSKATILLALGAALVAIVALLSAAGSAAAISNCNAEIDIDSEEAEFLRLINDYRADNGLPPLALSQSLTRASAWKSQDMASNAYFAHDDPSLDRTFADRIRDCGYTYNTWLGENLAAGSESAAATFEQWRESPGHDTNMLSENYSAIGIARAYVDGSPYGWYWTTDFGGALEEGDVTCDDDVGAIDAQLVLQHVAGLLTPMPCADQVDVDGDGVIGARDAALILQYSAGLVSGFPAT